jgi:5-hydroxyisourate hydrolase
MRSLSTHVLDAVSGEPAAGLGVRLAQRRTDTDSWSETASTTTDADGRVKDLAPAGLSPGVHRLVFDTEAYFTAAGRTGFYPEVTVTFTVTDERHYHVPLLLSPFAFSTYRGS